MLRLLGAALGLVLACTCVRAESTLLDESQASPALGRPFHYAVYLPDGYANGELRYPVHECTVAGNLRAMLRSLVPANDAKPHLSTQVPSLLVEGLTLAGK